MKDVLVVVRNGNDKDMAEVLALHSEAGYTVINHLAKPQMLYINLPNKPRSITRVGRTTMDIIRNTHEDDEKTDVMYKYITPKEFFSSPKYNPATQIKITIRINGKVSSPSALTEQQWIDERTSCLPL